MQVKGLDSRSSFNTDQQTVLISSLATGLPAITNVLLLNITVGNPGQAGMLAGISSAEPLTLEVRY